MKKITQFELINRIYSLKKRDWERINKSERIIDWKIINGIKYIKTSKNGKFKPFYMQKRFDPVVSIRYLIKTKVRSGDVTYIQFYLKNGEYVLVRGIKIVKSL